MSDLKQNLIEWLRKEGYPLEMRIAQYFKKHGLKTIQSSYYIDPETDKAREIDIVSTFEKNWTAQKKFSVRFIIESKASPDKPWLIFTAPTTENDNTLYSILRTSNAKSTLFLFSSILGNADKIPEPSLNNTTLFGLGDRLGYGLTDCFKNNQDYSYEALMSVAKSCDYELTQEKESGRKQSVVIFVPIIILDGHLFETYLNEDEEIEVEEIKSGTLVYRNPKLKGEYTLVTVLTTDFMEEYINTVIEDCELIVKKYSDQLLKILDDQNV